MSKQQLDVDQLDIGGNSALHLAAKQGNTSTASTLLHHGAQVSLKVCLHFLSADAVSGLEKEKYASHDFEIAS